MVTFLSVGGGVSPFVGKTAPFANRPAFVGADIIRPAGGVYKFAFLFGGKVFLLWFCWLRLAQPGPKPLFLLLAKEKAVLDSQKEKGRPVEILARCGTTGRGAYFAGVFLG